MVYVSPFEKYEMNYKLSLDADPLKFIGTLDQVLSELEDSKRFDVIALHPPRVIRALVDYKVEHPEKQEIESLLKKAIDISLNIYIDPRKTSTLIEELRGHIESSGNGILLEKTVNQPSDSVTWEATKPSRSRNTAQRLDNLTDSGDVLFIALAHGGVAAGMDVYLRYCELSGSKDSEFYVSRLSTQKKSDKDPRLTMSEIQYLKKEAVGRQVIVFDEDKASGRTLGIADDYFSRLFSGQKVHVVTNLDALSELKAKGYEKDLSDLIEYNLLDKDKHLKIVDLFKKKILKENIKEIYDYTIIKGIGENNTELKEKNKDLLNGIIKYDEYLYKKSLKESGHIAY